MLSKIVDQVLETSPGGIANLCTQRTRPVQTFGHAGTNLGRAAGRDLLITVVIFFTGVAFLLRSTIGAIDLIPSSSSLLSVQVLEGP